MLIGCLPAPFEAVVLRTSWPRACVADSSAQCTTADLYRGPAFSAYFLGIHLPLSQTPVKDPPDTALTLSSMIAGPPPRRRRFSFREDYYTPIPDLHYGIREASLVWSPGVAVSEQNIRVSTTESQSRSPYEGRRFWQPLHPLSNRFYFPSLFFSRTSVVDRSTPRDAAGGDLT